MFASEDIFGSVDGVAASLWTSSTLAKLRDVSNTAVVPNALDASVGTNCSDPVIGPLPLSCEEGLTKFGLSEILVTVPARTL